MSAPIIVWFQRDLRLKDHLALAAALKRNAPIIPLFIWSPRDEGRWPLGAAGRWWLHHSLLCLHQDLHRRGAPLILRAGSATKVLRDLVAETGAGAVYWHRRWEPAAASNQARVQAALERRGVEARAFASGVIHQPSDLTTRQGRPFQVYTAFWRAWQSLPPPARPLRAPRRIPRPARLPRSLPLEALELLPRVDWASGLRAAWTPGEGGAGRQMTRFLKHGLVDYADQRDVPAGKSTSGLSPHLAFGELSARQIWHAVGRAVQRSPDRRKSADKFLSELIWREFAYHVLHHFPDTPDTPLNARFARFPWRLNRRHLAAWQSGRTGYPIVDAGMRELWHTGWMHNRARMITASFLVKDLRIHWLYGARWFWDTLVDADLANNTLNWQWCAGCGADAAPYFRIFNPVTQARRFDGDGRYIRRWVPELSSLPDRWLFAPWEAPSQVLAHAGVELGRTYPRPLVDHAMARAEALAAFREIRDPSTARLP